MHAFAQDLRLVVRQLFKAPGFTFLVVLALALGIGATTAVFSLAEGILLRPLPFRDPDRLVLLGDHLGNSPNLPVTAREVRTYATATTAFSSTGAFLNTRLELSGGAVPEEVSAARMTAGVFPTLGIQPLIGRVFSSAEDEARQPLAVLSYALWLNRYHRDPSVLGQTVDLDRRAYTIIGVMPRDFEFPLEPGRLDRAQLWIPMSFTAEELSDNNGAWMYHMVARLKAGVTLGQAAGDANRVGTQIMRDFPASMSAIHIRGDVAPLREHTVKDARPLLRLLLAGISIVLLIACVNVAALQLVRAIRRRREYAVRLALGARWSAILRHSMLEGLVLSLTAGVLGLGIAAAVLRVTLHLLPESLPRISAISIDATVAGFALLLALLTGALCSLAPALAALRSNVNETLKEGSASTSAVAHSGLRSTLVVTEIAIALTLLTVAGVFLRSFQKMREVDPGFRPDHVLVASYQLPLSHYPSLTSAEIFSRAVIDRLSAKPGVVAIGLTNALPATGDSGMAAYTIGDEPVSQWKMKFAAFASVDGDYFRALGIPLLEGRSFAVTDNAKAPLVVIVNQTMAKHRWPDGSALGKRMHVGNPHKQLPWATVIGVVADTKLGARDEPSADQWYFPMQQPAILFGNQVQENRTDPTGGYIAVRSSLAPDSMAETVRATVAEIDPLLALDQMQPMRDVISNVEAPRRFNTTLVTAFAAGALLLAMLGIYAVVAFSVSLRAQEIAVRMALGAQRTNIARLILAQSAKMALLGCVLGVVGSLSVSRLLSSFVFEVSPTDPLIYLASAGFMVMVALLASALPAARAASADPVSALRST
ncbi:MAG TPA: ABC transporter permease [Bryocella sp.]|nr:ABC transporter permease [Bryocella sp.]